MQSPTEHDESTQEPQVDTTESTASPEADQVAEDVVAAEPSAPEAPKVSFDAFDLQAPLRKAIDTIAALAETHANLMEET